MPYILEHRVSYVESHPNVTKDDEGVDHILWGPKVSVNNLADAVEASRHGETYQPNVKIVRKPKEPTTPSAPKAPGLSKSQMALFSEEERTLFAESKMKIDPGSVAPVMGLPRKKIKKMVLP